MGVCFFIYLLTGAYPGTESCLVESTKSRFIRKKPVAGSKQIEDEAAMDQPTSSGLLPVEDPAQKERGSTQAAARAVPKKTYCVNLSGATVTAQHHRNKKTPAQASHVGASTIKGSPLAERKTKVFISSYSGFPGSCKVLKMENKFRPV